MSKKRFMEVDILRGVAVLGMMIFHIFFVLDYFSVFSQELYSGWWLILVRFVQFIFLGVVGVSMVLSYQNAVKKKKPLSQFYSKQWKKAFIIFSLGMVVSLVTFLIVPWDYVKFGILHLIGVSILILSLVVGRKYLALILGVLAIFAGFWLKKFGTTSMFLFILGLRGQNIFSLDYFPIFPWIGVVALGIFVGHLLYKGYEQRFRIPFPKKSYFLSGITFLGRHSLLIYMVHVPIIILTFIATGLLSIDDIL